MQEPGPTYPATNQKHVYTDEVREHALKQMALTSSRKAAEITGVPSGTIRAWAATEQGRAVVETARKEFSGYVAQESREVVALAFASVKDSLINGDERLTQNGERVRVKMAGRDAAVVGGIYIDKYIKATDLQLLDGQASPATPEAVDRLETISALLVKEYAKRKLADSTIEGELVTEASVGPDHGQPLDSGLPVGDRLSHHPPSTEISTGKSPKRQKEHVVPRAGRDRKLRKDAGSTKLKKGL